MRNISYEYQHLFQFSQLLDGYLIFSNENYERTSPNLQYFLLFRLDEHSFML